MDFTTVWNNRMEAAFMANRSRYEYQYALRLKCLLLFLILKICEFENLKMRA